MHLANRGHFFLIVSSLPAGTFRRPFNFELCLFPISDLFRDFFDSLCVEPMNKLKLPSYSPALLGLPSSPFLFSQLVFGSSSDGQLRFFFAPSFRRESPRLETFSSVTTMDVGSSSHFRHEILFTQLASKSFMFIPLLEHAVLL